MAPVYSKPHALAVPLAFHGHIHPLMAVSMKLVSAGFMVTFANTQTNHERLTDHENGMIMKGEADLLHFVSLEEEFPIERGRPIDMVIEMLKPGMRGAVARLLAQLNKKEPPVSLLVYGFRLMYVLDLAIAGGIPSLALWTQNAANFACNTIFSQDLIQLPADDSTLFTCARGVPPLKRTEISGFLIDNLPHPFPSDEYGRSPFRRVREATWMVINTFEELEATTMDTLEETLGFRPLALGPLVNAPSFTVSKETRINSFHSHLEWLQGHPKDSVLFIAFGTVVDMDERQLKELVLGLEASKQPFLWVFRADFCSYSKEYTIESLSKRLQDQGLLLPWAPQRDMLSHPAIGGFLTHCGWNSTIEAITMGVPMLTWPLFADQFLNRRCVVEQWGVGLGFEASDGTTGLVTRLEVEKKVRTLMQDERGKDLREKAKNLSSLSVRAYEEGGSSHRSFERLKEEIWSFHLKK